jgi:CRISPR-associated protein Cmr2
MKYTAITIGPIYRTLQSVKSTKAIWGASYLFSYLMKQIIKLAEINEQNVIVPYFGKVNINATEIETISDNFKNQTGLFPDRLMVKGSIPKLNDVKKKVISDFSDKIRADLGLSANTDVLNFLTDYLNISIIEVELDNDELVKYGTNLIFKLSNLLDTQELRNRVVKNADQNFLVDFLEKYANGYNFLVKNEFDAKPFPSTAEIATAEFSNQEFFKIAAKKHINRNKEGDQEEYYKAIKLDGGSKFRNYQKYIAVVQADGDNIGAFIKHLYTLQYADKLVSQFSKNLLSFAIESIDLIKKANGVPIYAGGDDLLYFTPVAAVSVDGEQVFIQRTFLTLIDEIDQVFHKYFTNFKNTEIDFETLIKNSKNPPSMSYGVSISYYKFPLNEALAEGVNQLFYNAKKTEMKNAVSYCILKHSGQKFGTTFHKDEPSYSTFKSLMQDQVKSADFINSIIYKLEPQKHVLSVIGQEIDTTKRNQKFENFFRNNFNESIHTEYINDVKELIPFLKHALLLFMDIYTENFIVPSQDAISLKSTQDCITGVIAEEILISESNKKNIDKIYAALRFYAFIINKEERE